MFNAKAIAAQIDRNVQPMNPTIARFLKPWAPPQSEVHKIVSEDQAQRIDAAMHKDKLEDGYANRSYKAAMDVQIQRQNLGGRNEQ